MSNVIITDPPEDDRPGDGIVILNNGKEYRIHKAWGAQPHVFVRYMAHGGNRERKLARNGNTALHVISVFRNEILHKENPLVPKGRMW